MKNTIYTIFIISFILITSCSNSLETKYHTIRYILDTNNVYETYTIVDGSKLARPTAPVKNKHIFTGWYKDTGLLDLWNFDKDIVTSDINLYAGWDAEKYYVGSKGPTGGWIFYDDEEDGIDNIPGFRYMEVSPVDHPKTDEGTFSDLKIWGDNQQDIEGADEIYIGAGIQNTLDIITGESATDNAANLCANYSITVDGIVYDDWFLPSIGEIKEIYNKLAETKIVVFSDLGYWTSTETSKYSAWSYDLHLDSPWQQIGLTSKNSYKLIRPVRCF